VATAPARLSPSMNIRAKTPAVSAYGSRMTPPSSRKMPRR
jgi:hypothetical protein